MTSPAEGMQYAHPDSPTGQAEAAAEAEAFHARAVEIHRRTAHKHLRNAATELRRMDRAVKRLGEDDLFDVEFEGNEATVTAARTQIDVALAALAALIPAAGA